MIRISSCYLNCLVCFVVVLIAAPSSVQASITYVDAKAGTSGNTHATGKPLKETSWADLTSNASGRNDKQWVKRAGGGWSKHNNGDVFQASVNRFGQIPEITTEVVGLDKGTYEVWVFFWEQVVSDEQNWVLDAGLVSEGTKSYSSPLGPVAGSDSTRPVNAASLNFSNTVSVADPGGTQKMFGINLGRVKVTDGRLKVHIRKQFGKGSGNRTIYDGIGYSLVTRNLATSAATLNSTASAKLDISEVVKKWQENEGGDWVGGDKSNNANSFHDLLNWKAPTSARSEGKGYDLHLSGKTSQAQASVPLQLTESSALIINDGATLDLNGNSVLFSGRAALVVDSAYLEEVGGMVPTDKNASLDLIVTNNAVINGGSVADVLCDFAGGSLLVTDSSCSLSSLVRGKVKITGYGSIEVSDNSKQVIDGSTIELASPRARFRFIGKSVDKVINEDLDKFSVDGALPIYGSNPEAIEAGDNILIRNDGGKGAMLSVVK